MSNPDNRMQNTLEERNRQEAESLDRLQRCCPRTYQLLTGTRFQLPPYRQADYAHYDYAVYDNARMLLAGAVDRCGQSNNPSLWPKISSCVAVLNEWLKRGMTTLFVERELGEALKRTDLPEGFGPQDLRWRWSALRLILPNGLFRVKDAQEEGDVFCVTMAKVIKGQPLDFPPALVHDARAIFGRPPLCDAWPYEGMLLFYFQRRLGPEHKTSLGLFGTCKLDERTLRALAEEIDIHVTSRPVWTPDLSAFLIGFKRFLFNVLLFLGSLPEEYEPDQVLRPGREKKGRLRATLRAARFLGNERYGPSNRPSGPHEPTGRKLPGHWRAGHWKRQPFGQGGLQRKLIWIQPYKTTGPESDA
jgi:hypothetical protein